MSRENLSGSEAYIQKHFGREDADLARVREALQKAGKFGINVSSSEGRLLQFLVGLSRARVIVEIGVLYGYSTLWMAKALPRDGQLIGIEKDPENFAVATELIKQSDVAGKVRLLNGDARQLLQELGVEPDLVFIDADKSNYRHYLDWAMEHVKVGGVIIGDNTFLFGHLIGEDRDQNVSSSAVESMRYFNEKLANADNFRATMVPTYEGMTWAQRLR